MTKVLEQRRQGLEVYIQVGLLPVVSSSAMGHSLPLGLQYKWGWIGGPLCMVVGLAALKKQRHLWFGIPCCGGGALRR